MTLKLIDLKFFEKYIRTKIYPAEDIHISKLKLFIAEKFGISDYVQNNIVEKLVEFGLLLEKNVNLYQLVEEKDAPKQS